MEEKVKLIRLLLVILVSCLAFPAFSNADPLEDARSALDNEDFGKAHALLAPLAETGNAEAQTELGVMYVNGQGG